MHSKAPEMLAAAVLVSMIFSFNDLVLILTGSGSRKHRGSPLTPPTVHCWAHGKKSIKFFQIKNNTELNPFVPSTSIITICDSFWHELIKVILWKCKSNWPVCAFYCFSLKLHPHIRVGGGDVSQICPLAWAVNHPPMTIDLMILWIFLCGWSFNT